MLPASTFGPQAVAHLRNQGIQEAIADLAAKLGPAKFEDAFGANIEQLDVLVANKTVTINRLLEQLPDGTPDPTPFCYDKPLYLCAFMFTGAWLTNALLKPVDRSRFVQN